MTKIVSISHRLHCQMLQLHLLFIKSKFKHILNKIKAPLRVIK